MFEIKHLFLSTNCTIRFTSIFSSDICFEFFLFFFHGLCSCQPSTYTVFSAWYEFSPLVSSGDEHVVWAYGVMDYSFRGLYGSVQHESSSAACCHLLWNVCISSMHLFITCTKKGINKIGWNPYDTQILGGSSRKGVNCACYMASTNKNWYELFSKLWSIQQL